MTGKFKGMQDICLVGMEMVQEEDKAGEEGAILTGIVHWGSRNRDESMQKGTKKRMKGKGLTLPILGRKLDR